jgi:hypothetical protein
MLEKLAGRLKWEQKPEGIRVAIPMRRSVISMLYGPIVVFWLVAATVHYWHLLDAPHPNDAEFTLQMVALGVYAVGFPFFLCWLAFTFTGDTLVALNPDEMVIQRRVLGIELVTRSFPTSHVSQLIYVAPGKLSRNQSLVDPNSSKIQFLMDAKTHSFAKGIAAEEARTLLEAMRKVYQFKGSNFA